MASFKKNNLKNIKNPIEITWRQAGSINSRHRVTGELGKPQDDEEWLKNYIEERRQAKRG